MQHKLRALKPVDCTAKLPAFQAQSLTEYEFLPLKQVSDQKQAEGAGQSSVQLGGFSKDKAIVVL